MTYLINTTIHIIEQIKITYVISGLNSEEIMETFHKKQMQKTNQSLEFKK